MTKTTDSVHRHRIAVLASGRGSNLAALLQRRHRLQADFVLVLANRDAPALQIGMQAGLNTTLVRPFKGETREAYDRRVAEALDRYGVTFVVLAGYMRIVSDWFIERYAGRLVNIHPSLLPAFPGLHPHREAVERGVKLAGATVHFVTPGPVDGGPIIAQRAVAVFASDSEDTLAARVLEVEHELFTDALEGLFSGRLTLSGDRVVET
ncbi:MAG: phosphoribosylglycinamide formyltransferase [Myxococcales bacterium]|nr:phosphoribosylglycinamide formyltransferase [Myxococcales bacterium]